MPNLMLFSLPNTGSDWLAENIAACYAGKYRREYFNPVCNLEIEPLLAKCFGCEGKYYENIASPVVLDDVYNNTFAKSQFTFMKENFSQYKVDFFVKRFQCFILYRKPEHTFPYSRKEVGYWLDCMHQSLYSNYSTLEEDVQKLLKFCDNHMSSIEEMRISTYVIYYYVLFKKSFIYDLPIIQYEDLLEGDIVELADLLKFLPDTNAQELAVKIIKSKKNIEKDFLYYNWIAKIYDVLPDYKNVFINKKV